MVNVEKEIEVVKRKIEALQLELERLEKIKYEKIGKIDLTKRLSDTDFPFDRLTIYLKLNKIETVQDLITTSTEELLKCRGVGPVILAKINDWLSKYNLTLK